MNRALLALALFAIAVAAAGGVPPPASDVYSPLVHEGTLKRERGEYAAATADYTKLLDLAKERGDQLWTFRAYFYLGLTKQEEAASDRTEKKRAEELREEAEELYERALALNPKSTATLINLADAEWDNGDEDDAIAWLEKGLAIGDDRYYVTFANRLGAIRLKRNDPRKAASYFRLAADREPESSTHHANVVDALFAAGDGIPARDETIDYLWSVLKHDQIDRTLETVQRLVAIPEFANQAAPDLLALLAQSLAQKDYGMATFLKSDTWRNLGALRSESPLGAALAELSVLYVGTFDGAGSFPQWQVAASASKHPQPVETFAALARSIAANDFRQRNFVRAEKYYELALELARGEADPELLRDLALTYAAQKKIEEVDQLLQKYEPRIHEQQSSASKEELEAYYRYHRMMASIYEALPTRDVRRDTFVEQLEHARATDPNIVEGGIHEQLALVYQGKGETGKSVAERLWAAEAYARRGALQDAREILATIPLDTLSTGDRERYAAVVDQTVVLAPAEGLTPEMAFTIKRGVLLSSQRITPKAERVRSEQELMTIGVSVNIGQRQITIGGGSNAIKISCELPMSSPVIKK